LGTSVEIGIVGYGIDADNPLTGGQSMDTDIDGNGALEKNDQPAQRYSAALRWIDLVPTSGAAFVTGQVLRVGQDFFLSEAQKSTLNTAIDSFESDGTTETSIGMLHAFYAHLRNMEDHDEPSARRIVVLMTDGGYTTNYSPGYAACAMKAVGIEVYTFNMATSGQSTLSPIEADCGATDSPSSGGLASYAEWQSSMSGVAVQGSCFDLLPNQSSTSINETMACLSSGNPGGEFGFDYAYTGMTLAEFQGAYDAILASILGAQATYTIPDPDPNHEGQFIPSTVDIKEGSNIEIPLPAGFSCTDEEQIIPLTINYAREGTITLSNVRANMCKL
jgi:hypothetical protein